MTQPETDGSAQPAAKVVGEGLVGRPDQVSVGRAPSTPLVVFEPNYKRRFHRVTIPLFLAIGGRTYRAADWSLGGFRIDNFLGGEVAGELAAGTLVLSFSDFNLTLPMRFRVVRRAGDTIGCKFIDLSVVARRALRHLLESAIEGRISEVSDTLGVLTAPIPSEPLEDLLQDEQDTHVQIGERRLVRKATVYLATGLVLLLGLGYLVYRNIMFIDIPAATVMGNFVSVATTADGHLDTLLVGEGEQVEPGQVLFELRESEVAAAVEVARARLQTARTRHAALLGQLEEEQDRQALFTSVSGEQVRRARADLRRVEAGLSRAGIEQARRERLVREGVLPQEDLDIALAERRALEEERAALMTQLEIARLNRTATSQGRYFGGQEIEGRKVEIQQAALVAESEIARARRELEVAVERLSEQRVSAPIGGKVYTVYRRVGDLLRSRDVVLSLQAQGGHFVVGRLQSDEALKVRPGMVVDVKIPAYRLALQGTITAIGHQGLSTASQSSADMESSLTMVPIKVQLHDRALELPPGVRARMRIAIKPFWIGKWKSGAETEDLGPIPAASPEQPSFDQEVADTEPTVPSSPGSDTVLANVPAVAVQEQESPASGDSPGSPAATEIATVDRLRISNSAEPCLSLRSGPGGGHGKLDCLEPGVLVEAVDQSGPWTRVRLDSGGAGWMASRFLLEVEPGPALTAAAN